MNIRDENDISRLALLKVEQNNGMANKGIEGYKNALKQLKRLKLEVIVKDKIIDSKAYQAGLLTIVNCGLRAFKGGVYITIPEKIPLSITWPGKKYLNEVISELGAKIEDVKDRSFTLTIGSPAKSINSLEIIANGWQGGVIAYNEFIDLPEKPDGILGGVYAGALAVTLGFLRVSNEKIDSTLKSTGISLWRPDLNWLDKESVGPDIKYFPSKLWFVGLGHLGQAYIWTLSLFSFNYPQNLEIFLQDTDQVKNANIDTGLLTFNNDIEKNKTRLCSDWLELRGIKTKLVERYFNENTISSSNEPDILICGFDNIESRRLLNIRKFKYILDIGLGSNKNNFDSISFHNLLAESKNGDDIWSNEHFIEENKKSKVMMDEIFECGNYDIGIGASFIGAISSTIVISELLRTFHKGVEIDNMRIWIRSFKGIINKSKKPGFYKKLFNYTKNGFIELV